MICVLFYKKNFIDTFDTSKRIETWIEKHTPYFLICILLDKVHIQKRLHAKLRNYLSTKHHAKKGTIILFSSLYIKYHLFSEALAFNI